MVVSFLRPSRCQITGRQSRAPCSPMDSRRYVQSYAALPCTVAGSPVRFRGRPLPALNGRHTEDHVFRYRPTPLFLLFVVCRKFRLSISELVEANACHPCAFQRFTHAVLQCRHQRIASSLCLKVFCEFQRDFSLALFKQFCERLL